MVEVVENGLRRWGETEKESDREGSDVPQRRLSPWARCLLYLKGSWLPPRMNRSFTGLQHRAPEFSRTATMCPCRTVAD